MALNLSFVTETKYHTWFNDFDAYNASDWTLTTTEAGAGSATEAVGNIQGGVLVITNDAADNDLDFFQWPKETFKFESGKSLYFEARLKVSDATQTDFVVGLQITDTTMLDVTDGIFFQKDDGDALLDFHCEKNDTASSVTGLATIADDTWFTCGFYYDGGGPDSDIDVIYNGEVVGHVALTNVPDDEELTVSFGIQNGEAVAKIMSVDYILVKKAR